MQAPIRSGPPRRRPTVMTKSSASSRPNARSAMKSRRAPRASPTLCSSRRPDPALTYSPAPDAGRSNSRLRRFDLAGSDAATSYRDLVRDTASMGPSGRASAALRSVWAYAGQRRLLVWAIIAFILGACVSLLPGEAVMTAIRGLATSMGPVADWVAAHADWFETAAKVLYLLGALALALNLWRALGFSSLLLRGAQLLNLDVRDRRRDLESRAARLNQRVAGSFRRSRRGRPARRGGGPPRRRQGAGSSARPRFPRCAP